VPIPAVIGQEAGYVLDRSSVHLLNQILVPFWTMYHNLVTSAQFIYFKRSQSLPPVFFTFIFFPVKPPSFPFLLPLVLPHVCLMMLFISDLLTLTNTSRLMTFVAFFANIFCHFISFDTNMSWSPKKYNSKPHPEYSVFVVFL